MQISPNLTLSFLNSISKVLAQKVAGCCSRSLAWGAKMTDASLRLLMQMRPQSRTPHQAKGRTRQLQMVFCTTRRMELMLWEKWWWGTNGSVQDRQGYFKVLGLGHKSLVCAEVWTEGQEEAAFLWHTAMCYWRVFPPPRKISFLK